MPDDEENELTDYAARYDSEFRIKPALRTLVHRQSKVEVVDVQDPLTGEWRKKIQMTRNKFNDVAKGIFLAEFRKWGRIGESARAAGVTPQRVRAEMERDQDFAEAMMVAENEYTDKLIGHHQNLVFEGQKKINYDRNGNVISEETIYPIRLIELELKKHDKGYREKQEIEHTHKGGVLIAPAEMTSIDDWESRFGQAKDVTPTEDEEEDPFG